jgi:hypothetical protein
MSRDGFAFLGRAGFHFLGWFFPHLHPNLNLVPRRRGGIRIQIKKGTQKNDEKDPHATIVKNRAFSTRFSESPLRMTNDKCSMTNSQFRLIPLVAAGRAVNIGAASLARLGLQTITSAQDATPPAQGLENIL